MKPIDAYEVEAVVDATSSVHIAEVPFAKGERLRVLIMREGEGIYRHSKEEILLSKQIRERLKGSVLRDEVPFEPAVPAEDWNAINGTGLI